MIASIPWARDLGSSVDAFGELPAISDGAAEITYRALGERAARLAEDLLESGLKPGEPVATFLRNSIPAVWASYGIKIAGAAETPLNPALSPEERRYCIELAGVQRVVTTAAEAPFFASLGLRTTAIEQVSPNPGDLARLPPVPAQEWGRIIFTSGTTGRPKAIIHTPPPTGWRRPSLPQPGSRALPDVRQPFPRRQGNR